VSGIGLVLVCTRVRYEVDKSKLSMPRGELGEGRIRKRDAVNWGGADSEKGPCMIKGK